MLPDAELARMGANIESCALRSRGGHLRDDDLLHGLIADAQALHRKARHRVPVGACLLVEHPDDVGAADCRLLWMRRTGAHGDGTWCFPGGWVEPGEDPLAAATRETWEEVGLNVLVEAARFVGYTSDDHPEGLHAVTLWFRCSGFESGTPRIAYPDRVTAIRWATIEEPPSPLFLPVLNGIREGLLA